MRVHVELWGITVRSPEQNGDTERKAQSLPLRNIVLNMTPAPSPHSLAGGHLATERQEMDHKTS